MLKLSAPKRGLKPATTCANHLIQFIHTFIDRTYNVCLVRSIHQVRNLLCGIFHLGQPG